MSAQILSYMQPSKRGHEKKNTTSQLLKFQIKVELNQPVLFYKFLCALLFNIATPGSKRMNQTLGLHRESRIKVMQPIASNCTFIYRLWKHVEKT